MSDSLPKELEKNRIAPSRHLRRSVSVAGYVVGDDAVKRLDKMAEHLVRSASEASGGRPLAIEYSCLVAKSESLRFTSCEELLAHADTRQLDIRALRSSHEVEEIAGLALSYQPDGNIVLSAYGSTPDLEFNVDRVLDELGRTVEESPWWVRRLVMPRWPTRALRVITSLGSVFLLILIALYLYAVRFGVNIDESVAASVPYGLGYKAEVAEAVRSTDLSRKLDVLLYGQLQDFTTLDQWLLRTQSQLAALLLTVVVAGALLLLTLKMERLYPRAFFPIGRSRERLGALQRKRDFWEGAVVVAFLVNLIAGLVIAWFV